MPKEKLKILLIEDNPGDARLIQEMLTEEELASPFNRVIEFIHVDRLSDALKKMSEGKTGKQALKAVMRRLVNIVYGMMRHKTEYINPELPKVENQ